ncbi:MAG: hypothetical protein IJP00_01000 [Firmicutes bacterium]|nr:hypothetical protein [Bacillota bacterium]
MELKVQIKQAGRKASAIENHIILYEHAPESVGELLVMTVQKTLEDFKKKDDLKGNKDISTDTAIKNALQSFEDGLVALFIDDKRYEDIDEKLSLTGSETLTFVKLTMLAGRMW